MSSFVFSWPGQPLVCRSAVPAHATCSEHCIWQSHLQTYLSPALDPRPHTCPSQQAHCGANEDKDDGLVLGRVSLEARGQDVLLFLSGAEAISEAELAVAVIARLPRGAGLEFGGSGLLGGSGRVQGYDGTVAKTGALAEGCSCYVAR